MTKLNSVIPRMAEDGVFKQAGFEPNEEAVRALLVAFLLKLDEKYRELVKLNRDVGGLPGMDAPKPSGCMGVLLLVVALPAAFALLICSS